MKCTYCGHELSEGSEFCENCGMILGFNSDDAHDKKSESAPEPEYTPNVFMAIDLPEEDDTDAAAMELPVSDSEETVTVTENIPEFVSAPEESVNEEADVDSAEESDNSEDEPTIEIAEGEFEIPEYKPLPDVVITAKKSSDKVRVEPVKKAKKKLEYKETYNIESIPLKEETESEMKEPQEIYSDAAETVAEEPIAEVVEKQEAAEETAEVVEPLEEIAEVHEETDEEDLPINIFEDISSGDEVPEVEEYEDITPDYEEVILEKRGKKGGKGLAVAVVVVVLCAIAVGAYALRDVIPVLAPTEESTLPSQTTDVKETTDVPSTEETTEEESTENITTEEATTEETTTEEVTTENVTDEEPSSNNIVVTKPTTTKPTTTKPTTTKPTTTKPTTTKPTTTKPTTTKPTTTDPYGINNVSVKKPTSFIKSYTAYATAEGINLRSGPATSYDRVLYLSKGADLKVLAKENGFLYVYSNRYGVYGWVSASYVSESRPEAENSTVHTGTVAPDVTTKTKTMYTTYSLNIRKGPSTKYQSVQVIPTGYPVKVTGYKSGVSGWVYVTDLTYGVSGWVSSDYLK